MPPSTILSLDEFVLRQAADEQRQQWNAVRDAPRSEPTFNPEPPSGRAFQLVEGVQSTARTIRMEILAAFEAALREALDSGRWVASAQLSPGQRIDLRPAQWRNARLYMRDDRLGDWCDVEIRERDVKDRIAICQRLIEDICNATQPGAALTRETIQAIAERYLGDAYKDLAFKAAWADAKIVEGWNKPGPRGSRTLR